MNGRRRQGLVDAQRVRGPRRRKKEKKKKKKKKEEEEEEEEEEEGRGTQGYE
jgi:hypothetical protein